MLLVNIKSETHPVVLNAFFIIQLAVIGEPVFRDVDWRIIILGFNPMKHLPEAPRNHLQHKKITILKH